MKYFEKIYLEGITMKSGFVPALGTPLDESGNLCVESYKKQIEDQIRAGASAVLCMGSMGQQAFLTSHTCVETARTAVDAVAGRVPVFVGAMDCSIRRARERMDALEDLNIAAFVFTAPYYQSANRIEIVSYFKGVAASTRHDIMLYDLPGVTQSKITYDIVLELLRNVPNLAGIKSADIQMFRKLKLNPDVPKDFIMVYSGLDTFDIAYKWGIDKCLDGMLSCTPKNTHRLFTALAAGNDTDAAAALNNIIELRDFFVAHDLWPSFSTAMNLLGYAGNFSPDYILPLKEGYEAEIRNELEKLGEL